MTAAAASVSAAPTALPPVERRATLPGGFRVAGATAGIKASGRPDLVVVATTGGPAAAAAVFTQNAFAAAPVRLSQAHLRSTEPAGDGRYGYSTAIVSTSGCANAATGAAGDADQQTVTDALASALGIAPEQTLALSTGVIGTRLPLDRILPAIARVVEAELSATDDGLVAAAEALRTTDSRPKAATTTVELPGADGRPVTVRVSGIAKGVGMIHPNMATMLSIVLTDATVDPPVLHGLLRDASVRTWNQLSVDGDTSTNDTVFLLASGAAGGIPVTAGSTSAAVLGKAIEAVARDLARQQASDGEGATTLITCAVGGAADDVEARAVARSVVSSSLIKAAIHGRDPNWGRIVAAAGNAAATIDPDRVRVEIAGHPVFDGAQGGPLRFDREAARAAMTASEVVIGLDLGIGTGTGEAFGCDLTEEYVIENSEYTT